MKHVKCKCIGSISEQYVHNNIDCFNVLVRKAIVNFRFRILESDNSILKGITMSSFFHYSSHLTKKWNSLIF